MIGQQTRDVSIAQLAVFGGEVLRQILRRGARGRRRGARAREVRGRLGGGGLGVPREGPVEDGVGGEAVPPVSGAFAAGEGGWGVGCG